MIDGEFGITQSIFSPFTWLPFIEIFVISQLLSNNMDWDNEKFRLNNILADDKYPCEDYYDVRLRFTGSPLNPFEVTHIYKADCKNYPFNGLH